MKFSKIPSFVFSLLMLFSMALSASPPVEVGWLDEGTGNERIVIPFEIPQGVDALSVSLAIEATFSEYLDLEEEGSIYSAQFSDIFSESISPPNLSVLGLHVFEANIPYSRTDTEDGYRQLNATVRVDVRDRENPKLILNPLFWQCKADNYVPWSSFYDAKTRKASYYANFERLPARRTSEKTAIGLTELLSSNLSALSPGNKENRLEAIYRPRLE